MIKISGYLIQPGASIEFSWLYIMIQSCSTSLKEFVHETRSEIFSPGYSYFSTTDENPDICLENYTLFILYSSTVCEWWTSSLLRSLHLRFLVCFMKVRYTTKITSLPPLCKYCPVEKPESSGFVHAHKIKHQRFSDQNLKINIFSYLAFD